MMEKEIEERHAKQREQRLVAERRRLEGNEHFKNKQYSEALKTYCLGKEAGRCTANNIRLCRVLYQSTSREKRQQHAETD